MSKSITVRCISPRLNHVVFGNNGNGSREPRRVRVGETFQVAGIPPEWAGLVIALDGSQPEEKVPVVNPDEGEELTALKAEYKEKTGLVAHHTWDADKIREKLDEAGGGDE